MRILYLENATWEYEFILNDILYNIENKEVEFFGKNNFNLLLDRTDIVENNILVISIECRLEDIIKVVKHIKPIIIFYLSDEYGTYKDTTILEKYTKILFRQYNHKNYIYSKNNHQLPLGYCKLFLNGNNSLLIEPKKMIERNINASFIGAIKSDRLVMANAFKKNMEKTNIIFVNNSWNINNLPYSPEQCFNIYNDSIFVISGRGNYSLDCFRIYEAIVAGSIPVVVGSFDEIKTTFNYNDNIPPFIYGESWEEVVVKCNNLLVDYGKLQKLQDELLLWWKNQILVINKLVTSELDKS